MNGSKWNFDIKSVFDFVRILVIIIIIPWSVWVTNNVYAFKAFSDSGPRFTERDAELLELKIYDHISEEYLPKEVRDDIKDIKKDVSEIKLRMAKSKN